MDEIAKTEVRNYLSAAGFFMLSAYFILLIFKFLYVGRNTLAESNNYLYLAIGIGLLIIATLLIILRKRDMISILFFMIGFYQLFLAFTSDRTGGIILIGFLVLVALVTLTSKEKIKWFLFLIPAIMFVRRLIPECFGYDAAVYSVFSIILTVLSLYFAICCASERICLPGRRILTADEASDFKASGSVLGYMLFALESGIFALLYLINDASVLSLEAANTIKIIICILMVYVSILLLTVGKMRFTPVMFLLTGLALLLSVYSSGYMTIGVGILIIVIGLFAILRKESRILPGIMLIIFGCTGFISAISKGILPSMPWLSVILNGLPCLIAIYLSFVVYSQRKLPKF